jgi:hypothetical protein
LWHPQSLVGASRHHSSTPVKRPCAGRARTT